MFEVTARYGVWETILRWRIKMWGGRLFTEHFMWALHRRLDSCLSISQKAVLHVLAFAISGYLHFQLSLATLFERRLRFGTLAGCLRGLILQRFLRAADIGLPRLLAATLSWRLVVDMGGLVCFFSLGCMRCLSECWRFLYHFSTLQECACSYCCCDQEPQTMAILGTLCLLHLLWQLM